MNEFISSRIASFKYAFQGWGYAMRTQRNVWIHTAIAILVFFMGLWLQLPARDWAVIILTAAMVFAAEFMNTAIESVVDLATAEHHPLAKAGKDVGAGAVLVAAFAAVLVGLLILGPPLWQKLKLIYAF